jgi:hypothetical protein
MLSQQRPRVPNAKANVATIEAGKTTKVWSEVGLVFGVADDEVGDLGQESIAGGQVMRVDVELHLVDLQIVLARERTRPGRQVLLKRKELSLIIIFERLKILSLNASLKNLVGSFSL